MQNLKYKFLLSAILLLAFTLRIVAIDRVPPGLSHDEAYNGVTAIQVLNGQPRIFFEINKGIEPLIIYLEALAFYAFGIGPVSLRLVNVFCGLLTVALVYPLAARLFNRRVALLAMAGLAISFWAIFVSRLTLRAVTFPPLLMLTLYFLWRGLGPITRSNLISTNLRFFVLSGLAAGASMYTYLSSRFVPLLVASIFGYQLARAQIKRQHWVGLIMHLLIWAVLFAPLANYYRENAASFTERYNQVSTLPYALNGEFGPLLRNTFRTLDMFTFQGDKTDRYNLNGRPVFDWANGLLFYLGIGIILGQLRRSPELTGPAGLLLLWLLFTLLPDFITDDSPHFLRTIGAMPAVYSFWAVGLDWLSRRMSQWRIRGFKLDVSRFPRLPSQLILILLLLTTFHTGYDYFGRWASASEARYIYGADIAEIADYLKAKPNEGLPVISAEYYRDLDRFRFAIHFQGHPPFVIWFDGRQTLAFPPPASDLALRYIFSASAPPAETWLPFLQPAPTESGQAYTVYHLPDNFSLRQAGNNPFSTKNNLIKTNINDDLILAGYQVLGTVVSGGKFQVLLGWQALRTLPPGTDYTFLARLRDRQGHLWVEADGNGYNPADWQPGVQALQLLTFRLPGDLPQRAYHLTVEVVDRRQGQALPATSGETVIPLTGLVSRLADTPRLMDLDRLPNPIANLPLADSPSSGGPELALRGYRVETPRAGSGETLSLTLHWQVLKQSHQNYKLAFFLVNDPDDAPPAFVYSWPAIEPIGGEWPTSRWPANYWVQDKVDLPIGPDVPTGQFKLWGTLLAGEPGPASWVESQVMNPATGFKLGAVAIGSR